MGKNPCSGKSGVHFGSRWRFVVPIRSESSGPHVIPDGSDEGKAMVVVAEDWGWTGVKEVHAQRASGESVDARGEGDPGWRWTESRSTGRRFSNFEKSRRTGGGVRERGWGGGNGCNQLSQAHRRSQSCKAAHPMSCLKGVQPKIVGQSPITGAQDGAQTFEREWMYMRGRVEEAGGDGVILRIREGEMRGDFPEIAVNGEGDEGEERAEYQYAINDRDKDKDTLDVGSESEDLESGSWDSGSALE
ncbi:hypothetical protein F0562_032239 [Nyssa sinensis]|uniref:Uncharacterized protein n=1 Tax=Nyssa sinensis TaxID=561372 RepID=A0A5J5ANH8_9ASTE|nr:hypothetical protein F0562_032239 [Nyssa sinensis]